MNTNDVLSLLSHIISQKFDNIGVYKEKTIQGGAIPCFYIYSIDNEHEKKLGRRYSRSFKLAIKYFSDNTADCYKVADVLTGILEYMKFNEYSAMGLKMNYRVEDETLHFYINVDVEMMTEKEYAEKMRELEVGENVRK